MGKIRKCKLGEQLMWRFQRVLPEAKPGEKWLPMESIFKLESGEAHSGHVARIKR
jgi:hypothetical protein